MVEADFGGDFMNCESIEENSIVEILEEGSYQEVTISGKKKNLLNIPVRVNGKELLYSPGQKAGKILVTAWGKETKNWKGKKFQAKFVTIEFAGIEKRVIRPKIIEEKV